MVFHTEITKDDEVVVHVVDSVDRFGTIRTVRSVADIRPGVVWSRCEVENGDPVVRSEEDFSDVEPEGTRCEWGCFP